MVPPGWNEQAPFWEDPEDDKYWGRDDVLNIGADAQSPDKLVEMDR